MTCRAMHSSVHSFYKYCFRSEEIVRRQKLPKSKTACKVAVHCEFAMVFRSCLSILIKPDHGRLIIVSTLRMCLIVKAFLKGTAKEKEHSKRDHRMIQKIPWFTHVHTWKLNLCLLRHLKMSTLDHDLCHNFCMTPYVDNEIKLRVYVSL